MNYIPRFREIFPELDRLGSEELADRFCELGLDFYTDEKVSVNNFIALTLPVGLLLFVIMFILMPIKFMITGSWGYSHKYFNPIFNWFRLLKLEP